MSCKFDVKKVVAAALDAAITPMSVKALSDHDAKYHPNGYEPGQFCKFRKAMEKGDDADMLAKAESEEAETFEGLRKALARLENLGKTILTMPKDDGSYDAVLDSFEIPKNDTKKRADALKIVRDAAEDYNDRLISEDPDESVLELKALVIRTSQTLFDLKDANTPTATASQKPQDTPASVQQGVAKRDRGEDLRDLAEVRSVIEGCARLLNGRAGNLSALQASSRWPLLQNVCNPQSQMGSAVEKVLADLEAAYKNSDSSIMKVVDSLKDSLDKIKASAKNNYGNTVGMVIGDDKIPQA